MKKIAFLASFLCALVTFCAASEGNLSAVQLQFKQYFMARFMHAVEISGGKELTTDQTKRLEQAADEFANSVAAVYEEYHLTQVMNAIYQSEDFHALQQRLLKTQSRVEYLDEIKKSNAYIDQAYNDFENPEILAKIKSCALKFLKAVESLPGMPKLNEKTEFSFWVRVLFPYTD